MYVCLSVRGACTTALHLTRSNTDGLHLVLCLPAAATLPACSTLALQDHSRALPYSLVLPLSIPTTQNYPPHLPLRVPNTLGVCMYVWLILCGKYRGVQASIPSASGSFETVEQFKYLGTALTDQNCIQEEVKRSFEVRQCLLSFGAECFVFQFAIQKYRD